MLLIIISFLTIIIGLWISKPEEILSTVVPIKTTKYNSTHETYFEPKLDHYIIVTGEYEPYVYTEKGVNKGFEYEMMVKILEEMDIDYEIQMMSWARGLYLLNTGDAFGTFPYSETSKREQKYVFTDSLIDVKDRKTYFYYYQKENAPFVLDSVEDLKRYKVGGISGYYYTQIYDELGINYDLSIDKIECFSKLKEGRIETVPIDPIVAEALINKYFPDDKEAFKRSDFAFSVPVSGDRLMINKEDPRAETFITQFNQVLYKLKSSGVLNPYNGEK